MSEIELITLQAIYIEIMWDPIWCKLYIIFMWLKKSIKRQPYLFFHIPATFVPMLDLLNWTVEHILYKLPKVWLIKIIQNLSKSIRINWPILQHKNHHVENEENVTYKEDPVQLRGWDYSITWSRMHKTTYMLPYCPKIGVMLVTNIPSSINKIPLKIHLMAEKIFKILPLNIFCSQKKNILSDTTWNLMTRYDVKMGYR